MIRAFLTSILLIALTANAGEVTNTNGDDIGVKIIGSIIQKSQDSNVALIKLASGSVKAVKRGHLIGKKFKVVSVTAKYMEIVNKQSHRYFVFLDKFNGSAENGTLANLKNQGFSEEGFERKDGKMIMSALYRDKLVKQDMAAVLMQATAEPVFDGGTITGFRMSQIEEDSIYQKGGLENGDIIKNINGTELNSVAGSITLLRSLKSEPHFEIEVIRNGKSTQLTLDIQD